jgi:hypothetical protein
MEPHPQPLSRKVTQLRLVNTSLSNSRSAIRFQHTRERVRMGNPSYPRSPHPLSSSISDGSDNHFTRSDRRERERERAKAHHPVAVILYRPSRLSPVKRQNLICNPNGHLNVTRATTNPVVHSQSIIHHVSPCPQSEGVYVSKKKTRFVSALGINTSVS